MSEIRATTISDAAGTGPIELYKQIAAKATLRCTLPTTIYSSFNISSMTDRGTGIGRASFTSSMDNGVEYTVVSGGTAGAENDTFIWWEGSAQTTTNFDWTGGTSSDTSNTLVDISLAVVTHGDLA